MNSINTTMRAGAMAFILALFGFSYALATSSSDSDGVDASDRATGVHITPGGALRLDFANPVLGVSPFPPFNSEYDLGDYVVGVGSVVSRMIRAKGGVPPYRFTTVGTTPVVGLKLLANGILSGTPTAPSGAAATGNTPFEFTVRVDDSSVGIGSSNHQSKTGIFRLTYFVTSQFRFAVNRLSDGVQFSSYSEIVSTINGALGVTYTSSNVALNGKIQGGGLSDIGLSLSSDGALFGTPIQSGTLTFTCVATDKKGSKAAGRDGSGSSQLITIQLLGSKSISSLIVASEITIQQGYGKDRKGLYKDYVKYYGNANLLGNNSITSLSGLPFTFHIGSYTGPVGNFDDNGIARTTRGSKPSLYAKVSSSSSIYFSSALEPFDVGGVSGTKQVKLPVEVRIGDSVIGSEFLTFKVRHGRGSAMKLTYKAKNANDSDGSFQLTSVYGSDDSKGTGDSWRVGFIGRPGPIKLDTSKVNISIGSGFSELKTSRFNRPKFSIKGAKTDFIKKFALDLNKGKGSFETNLLPTIQTGISAASKSPGKSGSFTTNFTFGDATTGFSFEGAKIINASRSSWSSRLGR